MPHRARPVPLVGAYLMHPPQLLARLRPIFSRHYFCRRRAPQVWMSLPAARCPPFTAAALRSKPLTCVDAGSSSRLQRRTRSRRTIDKLCNGAASASAAAAAAAAAAVVADSAARHQHHAAA